MKQGDREVKKQPLRKSLEAQRDPTAARGHASARSPGQSVHGTSGSLQGRLQGRAGRVGAGGAAKAGQEGPEGPPSSLRDLFGNPSVPVHPMALSALPIIPFPTLHHPLCLRLRDAEHLGPRPELNRPGSITDSCAR